MTIDWCCRLCLVDFACVRVCVCVCVCVCVRVRVRACVRARACVGGGGRKKEPSGCSCRRHAPKRRLVTLPGISGALKPRKVTHNCPFFVDRIVPDVTSYSRDGGNKQGRLVVIALKWVCAP